MMEELMTLVIDQGTMIDRIDYNIEMTKTHIEAAHEQLKKADKEHQSANMKTCIILLIVVIVMFASLIFAKRLFGTTRRSRY
jgi:syntaxin 16